MKKLLIILVIALFAAACSSSKANVPDDGNSDSDSSTINDEAQDETADETVDDSVDRVDEEDDVDTGEKVDEKSDEVADIDSGLCTADQCEIEGKCYDDGKKDPLHLCNICEVSANRTDWTPATSGIVCRIASGDCDVAEKCDGISADCPEDAFKPLDTACGSITDTDCDDPDTCDGFGVCKENYIAASTACTDDNDDCNGTESCDGSGSCISEGPAVVCGDNEVCNPSGGICECDEENSYFLSPDETFCAFAGNKVPPTGQTKCYNATVEIACPTHASGLPFFGQDAQYTDNERTFTIVGDSPDRVVTDSLTGLTWELDYDLTQRTWDEAQTYCSSLGTDWRMPTLKELVSTLNFDYSSPVCDITYCPNNSGNFWSVTVDGDNTANAMNIYFYTGDIRSSIKTENYYIRCVKGTPFDPSGTISDDGDASEPVATDSLTGLSWTKSLGNKTWAEALDSCEKLNYGGHDDWRLPNVNELVSVMEYSSSSRGVALPNTLTSTHWTSTTYVEVTTSVVYFSFSSGGTSRGSKTGTMNHVCVR